MTKYKTEYLIGIGYRQRLQMLQDHYLGAYKARRKADGKLPSYITPGTEQAKVYLEGRF